MVQAVKPSANNTPRRIAQELFWGELGRVGVDSGVDANWGAGFGAAALSVLGGITGVSCVISAIFSVALAAVAVTSVVFSSVALTSARVADAVLSA